MIVTDASLCVIGMSPTARHHFARSDWHGKTLDDLLPDQLRAIVMRSVIHVCATKQTDSFQLRVGPNADRRMDVTIQPYGDGVCIVGRDRSASDASRDVGALSHAVQQTLDMLGSVAVLRINTARLHRPRDRIVRDVVRPDARGYRSVRLPTLFDIATRDGGERRAGTRRSTR